ncbi:unnamed protein product [Prunus armeniaca]
MAGAQPRGTATAVTAPVATAIPPLDPATESTHSMHAATPLHKMQRRCNFSSFYGVFWRPEVQVHLLAPAQREGWKNTLASDSRGSKQVKQEQTRKKEHKNMLLNTQACHKHPRASLKKDAHLLGEEELTHDDKAQRIPRKLSPPIREQAGQSRRSAPKRQRGGRPVMLAPWETSMLISCLKELSFIFTKEYTIKKQANHLFNVHKKHNESFRDYIKRFKAEKANIVGFDERNASSIFKKGLPTEHDLYHELTIAPSQTLAEVFMTAKCCALLDEDRIATKKCTKQVDQSPKKAG